jgi:hypothetical protein
MHRGFPGPLSVAGRPRLLVSIENDVLRFNVTVGQVEWLNGSLLLEQELVKATTNYSCDGQSFIT